jgi:hypothetical protein
MGLLGLGWFGLGKGEGIGPSRGEGIKQSERVSCTKAKR